MHFLQPYVSLKKLVTKISVGYAVNELVLFSTACTFWLDVSIVVAFLRFVNHLLHLG